VNVTGLGNQKVILGFPWLKESNPTIDWKEGTASWKDRKTTFQETPSSSDHDLLLAYLEEEEEDIGVPATGMAIRPIR